MVDRETDYTAGAERVLALAEANAWTVVSMAKDWTQVFDEAIAKAA